MTHPFDGRRIPDSPKGLQSHPWLADESLAEFASWMMPEPHVASSVDPNPGEAPSEFYRGLATVVENVRQQIFSGAIDSLDQLKTWIDATDEAIPTWPIWDAQQFFGARFATVNMHAYWQAAVSNGQSLDAISNLLNTVIVLFARGFSIAKGREAEPDVVDLVLD